MSATFATPLRAALALAASLSLAACASTPYTGPAEVVSFAADDGTQALGRGTIFVETAPGQDANSLWLAPWKAAVARELASLGYTEAPRDSADQVAQVRLDRFVSSERLARRRGPVSVGVGGSTGSYGSGVGVGVGINLGGNRGPRETVDTQLGVMIRDRASGETLWEGRAGFDADTASPYADPAAGADALADALFAPFPNATSDPVIVELGE